MTKASLMEQVRRDAESFDKYPEWKKSALTRLMDDTKFEGQAKSKKKANLSEEEQQS